jgi:hypothetical protein
MSYYVSYREYAGTQNYDSPGWTIDFEAGGIIEEQTEIEGFSETRTRELFLHEDHNRTENYGTYFTSQEITFLNEEDETETGTGSTSLYLYGLTVVTENGCQSTTNVTNITNDYTSTTSESFESMNDLSVSTTVVQDTHSTKTEDVTSSTNTYTRTYRLPWWDTTKTELSSTEIDGEKTISTIKVPEAVITTSTTTNNSTIRQTTETIETRKLAITTNEEIEYCGLALFNTIYIDGGAYNRGSGANFTSFDQSKTWSFVSDLTSSVSTVITIEPNIISQTYLPEDDVLGTHLFVSLDSPVRFQTGSVKLNQGSSTTSRFINGVGDSMYGQTKKEFIEKPIHFTHEEVKRKKFLFANQTESYLGDDVIERLDSVNLRKILPAVLSYSTNTIYTEGGEEYFSSEVGYEILNQEKLIGFNTGLRILDGSVIDTFAKVLRKKGFSGFIGFGDSYNPTTSPVFSTYQVSEITNGRTGRTLLKDRFKKTYKTNIGTGTSTTTSSSYEKIAFSLQHGGCKAFLHNILNGVNKNPYGLTLQYTTQDVATLLAEATFSVGSWTMEGVTSYEIKLQDETYKTIFSIGFPTNVGEVTFLGGNYHKFEDEPVWVNWYCPLLKTQNREFTKTETNISFDQQRLEEPFVSDMKNSVCFLKTEEFIAVGNDFAMDDGYGNVSLAKQALIIIPTSTDEVVDTSSQNCDDEYQNTKFSQFGEFV